MSTNASDLLTAKDPLTTGAEPERVNYATGVLLQAEDFRDEQTYHRSNSPYPRHWNRMNHYQW